MIVPDAFKKLSLKKYGVSGLETIKTPALLVYLDTVDHNIESMLTYLNGDVNRWRPHLKTAKISAVVKRFLAYNIQHFKCATSLELRSACLLGAADVLLALAVTGQNAVRVRELAQEFPATKVSVLCDSLKHLKYWEGSAVGIFIDIDTGMNRSGIAPADMQGILNILAEIHRLGLEFRGLHYYDGHLSQLEPAERRKLSHQCYEQLIDIINVVKVKESSKFEVITSGTPTFSDALEFEGLKHQAFIHRVSPGTIVYCDCSSMGELSESFGFEPAALVLTSVVSRPLPNRVTCDAGHKTVSADCGIPTCLVVGHKDYQPWKPSEEHLPIIIPPGGELPEIGQTLFLLARHICPTVNNFDHAVLIKDGKIAGVEPVDARGREPPYRLHDWHT